MVKIHVYADAAFAGNNDLTSQLGYVIALVDDNGTANVIHYSSTKARRATKSVLAAKLFAVAAAFDYASTLKGCIDDIYARDVPLVLCTYSRSLFELVIGLTSTTEKRLLIDLASLRKSYELRDIAEIVWIRSEANPSDGLTKRGRCEALEKLVMQNCITFEPNSWVERNGTIWKNKATYATKEKGGNVASRGTSAGG